MRIYPAPIDYATAEPDQITADEAAAAVLAVLERVAVRLEQRQADEHVTRCIGCGGWAWDEAPCSTCARHRAGLRRRASQVPGAA